ncbi:MAG: hypothetical protein HW374_161, partial [Bacteroidetes bacterium]|nr:hypothetical protein [Bacteroidota bacterium]
VLLLLVGDGALFHLAVKVGLNRVQSPVKKLLLDVVQDYTMAELCKHVSHAVSHRSGTYDGNLADFLVGHSILSSNL